MRRAAQSNRKAYCEDAQTVIRRQRATIEKVKEDNLALKRELETTASKARECMPRESRRTRVADPRAQEDSGPPNLLTQQEIVRLRESAMVFTHKVRAARACAARTGSDAACLAD